MGSEKIKAFFDKLPFQKWVTKAGEKIPFFTKIIPFANYIGSGLSVILLIGIINLAIPNGPSHTLKYLNKVNNDTARYWANFITKNGIDAINADNKTILLVAAASNNTELLEACLKDGADPNRLDGMVLRSAIYNKNPEACSLCMKHGAKFVPEDIMAAKYYDSVLDEVFIPYYKKNKCTDMTNSDVRILWDISPKHIANLSKEGFMFSFRDMVHLCTTYLKTVDDEISAKIYLDAIKNNCDHKAFLKNGVYNPSNDSNQNLVHSILFYLKNEANRIYVAENCKVIVTTDPDPELSWYHTAEYIGQPLYDIYTTDPDYDGTDITDCYKYNGGFRIITNKLVGDFDYYIVENDFLSCRLDYEVNTGDSSVIEANLASFYSRPDVQTQKEHFITLINFFEEQGY